MKKHTYALAGTLLLLGSVLAGCSGSAPAADTPASSGTATGSGSAAAVVDKPVELYFYHNGNITEEQFQTMYGNYMKEKLPNVTAKFVPKDKNVSLAEMISSGTTKIDIFIDSIGQIGLKGSLLDIGLNQDLTDLVKKHNVDLNRFEPTTLEAIQVMGGLYGMPISNSALVLMYNKDIFDKFGVAYPKDGMTWDDLADMARKLTRSEGGTQYVGYTTSINHFLRLNPLSLANIDPAAKTAALETDDWKKLIQETLVKPMQVEGYNQVLNDLQKQWYKIPYLDEFSKTRNVAMFSFMYGDYSWAKDMNWDVAALPTFADKPKIGSQAYPSYMFVTSTSEHKDEAMEVIKLFISDDYQSQLSKTGGITILKDEAIKQQFGSETPLKDKNIKNAVFYNAFAPAAPKTRFDTYVEDGIRGQITPLLLGETDLNTALRTAQEGINKKIEADTQ
ncbi:extracellular solute-binding protein [Paenibacillus doosanensis]|uniref:ABC transporter substrate-binding protein n=1 Tax=Paenibacillus doosanensis TaxID=1229154 RepID=UPI00217FE689|nr:extracellular solute-binding protein [Paenibacillus doosanensis]MCS7461918.1 extracellular solute-binding protein [Paenibacillus doosanensis]